jgi:hypothetical protein
MYIGLSDVMFRERGVDIAEYKQVCTGLISYVQREGVETEKPVDTVVFIDRSARLAYLGFRELWKDGYYNDIPIPKIRFLNPTYVSHLHKFKKTEAEMGYAVLSDYLKSLDRFISMNSLSGKKVLVYDTCIHSGKSIETIINYMRFKGVDIRVGVASGDRNDSNITPDFNGGFYGCNFFDSQSSRSTFTHQQEWGDNLIHSRVSRGQYYKISATRRMILDSLRGIDNNDGDFVHLSILSTLMLMSGRNIDN